MDLEKKADQGFGLLLSLGFITFIGMMNIVTYQLTHSQRQFVARQLWQKDLLNQAEVLLEQCELSFMRIAKETNSEHNTKTRLLQCCAIEPIFRENPTSIPSKQKSTSSKHMRGKSDHLKRAEIDPQRYQVSMAGQLVTHQASPWYPKIRLQSVIEINSQQTHGLSSADSINPFRRISWQEIIDPNTKQMDVGQATKKTSSAWENLDPCIFYPKSSSTKEESI